MPYLDAHLAKLRLAEDLATSDYERYIGFFDMSQSVQRAEHRSAIDQMPADVHVKGLLATLRAAETFTVSPQMLHLVQATAAEMPSEPLLPQDLPSLQGFLYLPEPFEEMDLHGRMLRQHLVVWTAMQYHHVPTDRNRYGIYLNWFTSRSDRRDELNAEMDATGAPGWDKIGKYMLMATNTIYFGDMLPKTPNPQAVRDLDPLMPPGWRMQYLVHEERFLDIDPETGESFHNVKYVPTRNDGSDITDDQFLLLRQAYSTITDTVIDAHSIKQLVCFWRLCQQTITGREYVKPDKRMTRLLRRRKFAGKPVTVITLRRTRHEHGNREIEWDHRWLRRGHWRQQWYGSGPERHQRAIYINPTICGPEDKPLLIRPHVNVLSR